jgi:putative Mg2+ transporter-C (MgtC) family protein
MDLPVGVFVGNVLLALVLGVLIGLEREYTQHPAGLRTTALVSVGAALFVSLTRLMHDTVSPTRIASYIVSGIGFLGGGVIIKEGANVKGITTAATLWCSAAIGTLCGAGFGWHAKIGTVAVVFVVIGLRPLSRAVDALRKRMGTPAVFYRLRVACGGDDRGVVRNAIARHASDHPGMAVTKVTTRKTRDSHETMLIADIHSLSPDNLGIQAIVDGLMIEPGVTSASWETLPAETE